MIKARPISAILQSPIIPPSHLMLNILHPRHLIQSHSTKLRNHLNLPTKKNYLSAIIKSANSHILLSLLPSFPKEKNEKRSPTYTLLHTLHILKTNPHPPQPPQMPRRLMLQVLNHDSRKHHQFRFESGEDAVVGEIQAVGYVSGDPG